jgi:hypothetical protein
VADLELVAGAAQRLAQVDPVGAHRLRLQRS